MENWKKRLLKLDYSLNNKNLGKKLPSRRKFFTKIFVMMYPHILCIVCGLVTKTLLVILYTT